MNYTQIPQENKAEILEQAVINGSIEEIAETYKELGHIEFSARALGLACRFRGAEIVRALIGLGATFDFPKTEEVEARYSVYSGMKYHNYRSDFSLYILNIRKQIKGACCCKGLKLTLKAARCDKTFLTLLPDSERAEALRVLCEHADKISFSPSGLLYYAIFARDDFMVSELKRLGVRLSDTRIKYIANGGPISESYWYEWLSMMKNLPHEDCLPVMKKLGEELGGKPFHCTAKLYDLTKKQFSNPEVFEFFLDNFKTEKLNKTQIVRDLIDINAIGSLVIIEKTGWLKDPKRREEIIACAQSKQDRIECVAWLLDYKNRTADLAAERLRAEKRIERELNASPTSVAVMKKTWGYKKQEDGTLIITNYKGTATEVTIPETIGKGTVTAVGNGAFAGTSGLCGGIVTSNASYEQMKVHRKITKLVLPESVNYIGVGAFADMLELTEINIPEGVAEIGDAAFYNCVSLGELVIPKTVRSIGNYAFDHCNKLTIIVEKNSFAEEYCRVYKTKYQFKEKL